MSPFCVFCLKCPGLPCVHRPAFVSFRLLHDGTALPAPRAHVSNGVLLPFLPTYDGLAPLLSFDDPLPFVTAGHSGAYVFSQLLYLASHSDRVPPRTHLRYLPKSAELNSAAVVFRRFAKPA
jgi:hypothetical protein